MVLDVDKAEWLKTLLAECSDKEHMLSDWEKNFVDDTRTRFEKYGADTFISGKQMAILERISEKLT